MTKTSLFLFFLVSAIPAFGQEPPTSVFQEANQAYEAGQWDQAETLYLNLVQRGFSGASLYYNLGNVAYRKGDRGAAVLWYERAKRLDPRDDDIRTNLAEARSHIKTAETDLWETVLTIFSPAEAMIASSIFLWIVCALIAGMALGWIRAGTGIQAAAWTTGILFAVAVAYAGLQAHWLGKDWAIVLSTPGEVRNGPGRDYAVGFIIPEGTRVVVLTKRPTWAQIGAPEEGLKGWIRADHIEEI